MSLFPYTDPPAPAGNPDPIARAQARAAEFARQVERTVRENQAMQHNPARIALEELVAAIDEASVPASPRLVLAMNAARNVLKPVSAQIAATSRRMEAAEGMAHAIRRALRVRDDYSEIAMRAALAAWEAANAAN